MASLPKKKGVRRAPTLVLQGKGWFVSWIDEKMPLVAGQTRPWKGNTSECFLRHSSLGDNREALPFQCDMLRIVVSRVAENA